ncbi:MAG: amidohydrolase, partial [Alkalinema sp. FL-bin-369]|nr:amidohydrolase [Leptolyngbyaceae cyanobacterium LF-bin-369]
MVASTLPAAQDSAQALQNVRLALRSLHPQVMTWRRQIHQHPELGFAETLTAQFIHEKLTQWDIPHEIG